MFISLNFLDAREVGCDGLPLDGDGPVVNISVEQLKAQGLEDLIVADLNHDGWLNQEDVQAFLDGALDPCEGDFNGDGVLNSADFAAYLNAFVVGDSSADFNDDGEVNSQDIIAYLEVFAKGC